MRIRCKYNDQLPYLTPNKIYTVFEFECTSNIDKKNYTMFRIEDDYGSVIPYHAKYFEIESNETTNYVERETEEGTVKGTHKFISYDKFWAMFYEEAGTSLEDFWKAKLDLYKREMSKGEMCDIIRNEPSEDERDFILDLLITEKDTDFIEDVLQVCRKKLQGWELNYSSEMLFKYLSCFKDDRVDDFFIEYITKNENGNERLNQIVRDYFDA